MTDIQKLQSNPVLKAIHDNLPPQVGLTEGIELSERILAAIQKVGEGELDEQWIEDQINKSYNEFTGTNESVTDAAYFIAAKHKEILLKYQSVPVSEDDFKKGGQVYDEFMTAWHTRSFDDVFSIIKKYTQSVSEEEKNVYREQGWDACNKSRESYLDWLEAKTSGCEEYEAPFRKIA